MGESGWVEDDGLWRLEVDEVVFQCVSFDFWGELMVQVIEVLRSCNVFDRNFGIKLVEV